MKDITVKIVYKQSILNRHSKNGGAGLNILELRMRVINYSIFYGILN
jgi:hypothetical protein